MIADIRKNLNLLPRLEDGWTFLYIEHRQIHQDAFGINVVSEQGVVQLPISQIKVLLLGPGVSITSAAMVAIAGHGCSVIWTGENGVRFYASGSPKTNQSANLERQAKLWANPDDNLRVVRRMYVLRYGEDFPESNNKAQLRGYEGVRVKKAYAEEAARIGLVWKGRKWYKDQWDRSDHVNRCLSVASSCLYGLCHTAIAGLGFTPGLGFIHVGDMRSFTLDIADLYRENFTIPVAFAASAKSFHENAESYTRKLCRDAFASQDLIARLVPDIYEVMGITSAGAGMIDINAWEALKKNECW